MPIGLWRWFLTRKEEFIFIEIEAPWFMQKIPQV